MLNNQLEWMVGLRYLRARKRNHFISFISFIAISGIALAIILLITVLSVMNGFQQELRNRILIMTSHVTVTAIKGGLSDWPSVLASLARHPGVTGGAPYVRGEAMLSHNGEVQAALVRGILPEHEGAVSQVAAHMTQGSLSDLQAGKFGIVLGMELARKIGVSPGERLTVISPQLDVSPAGVMPRLKRFIVTGIFEVGMHEFDSGLALMHMQDASKLFRLSGKASGVRFQVDKIFDAPQIRYELNMKTQGKYWVSDWTRRHANFFRAVKMEKTVMFVILLLIVAVAAFNIVSTLVMVVTDKASDIAILRTLGMSPTSILRVFMIQGTVIGLLGVGLGLLGGVSLATYIEDIVQYIEGLFQFKALDPSIYYISELPSQILWSDVILVCGISFVVSVLATLYPALKASRIHPVEALRYE